MDRIKGIIRAQIIAPIFEPELNIPVANARSFLGNHSATVLIEAYDGVFPEILKNVLNLANLHPLS